MPNTSCSPTPCRPTWYSRTGPSSPIPVASTVACDYDRTFAVEVIDQGSNAIEGYHYRLKSNTITIPAGERTANVEVAGIYDHIQDTDSLGFKLHLVVPDQVRWTGLYAESDYTKVVLYKGCDYDLDTPSSGWCVVTSLLLYDYPSALDQQLPAADPTPRSTPRSPTRSSCTTSSTTATTSRCG